MTQFKLNSVDRLLDTYKDTKTVAEGTMEKTFGSSAVQDMVTHWSQLVAWSWLEPEADASPVEKELKHKFVKTVQKVGSETVKLHYCPDMETDELVDASEALSTLMKDEDFIDLYKKRTQNESFVFTEPSLQKIDGEHTTLVDKCIWMITVDHFTGWVAGTAEQDGEEKFVVVMSYPPRPALAESDDSPFLTKKKLQDWSQGVRSDYVPESPYIPTCGC